MEFPIAKLEKAGKVYGKTVKTRALQPTDLGILAGQFILLIGPSGSGKTTLLNILGGLDHPSEGKVWIQGREIQNLSSGELTVYRRNFVGFIFQFFNLVPSLTAK